MFSFKTKRRNLIIFFFFSSRRRHTRCLSDWSSDVCSSDLRRNRERVSPPWSCTASRRATRSSAMAPGDLVDGVARDEDLDHRVVVLDHGLATEARRGRQPGCLVEQVFLVLLRFREALEAAFHHHVAGGARTAPAAGVL